MAVISIALLVVFVLVCILIVALVLIQNEEGDTLGGIFAGGSNSAFGSRSASVLTKATYVVVTLFFVTAFFLAFVNKSPSDKGIENAARVESAGSNSEWWSGDQASSDAAAPAETAPADASTDAPAAQ